MSTCMITNMPLRPVAMSVTVVPRRRIGILGSPRMWETTALSGAVGFGLIECIGFLVIAYFSKQSKNHLLKIVNNLFYRRQNKTVLTVSHLREPQSQQLGPKAKIEHALHVQRQLRVLLSQAFNQCRKGSLAGITGLNAGQVQRGVVPAVTEQAVGHADVTTLES